MLEWVDVAYVSRRKPPKTSEEKPGKTA